MNLAWMRSILCLIFIVFFLHINANSQLCQGSLGDPIVNITFGTGSNPGAPLPGATTNYQYYSPDCPNDGFYSVRNSSIACYSNSWHTLNTDHTGNGNGYFMLVNGSFQPSAFYIDTVDLFCSNTTYEFAAWVMNVSKPNAGCNGNPIQPNLTFRIERLDGTIIQSYSTGNISTQGAAIWKQYGFFFTTPANISQIVLRLINNAPGGCGNDLALDDITFRPCGPLLNTYIDGSSTLKELCEGATAQYVLSCDVSGYLNPFIQWQQSTNNGITWNNIPGANSVNHTINFSPLNPSGDYLYRATVSEVGNVAIPQCRVASGLLTVKVNANSVVVVSNNGPSCEAGSLKLNATGGNGYVWSGPNAYTASGPSVTLTNITQAQAGKYYVQVTSNGLCKRIDSTTVIVNPRPKAFVTNDTLKICRGNSTTLTAGGGLSYLWSPAIGLSSATIPNPQASPIVSTNYSVIVSNQFACTDTGNVQVNVISLPVVNAGPDKIIVEGQSTQLNGSITGAANFLWSPNYNINDVRLIQPIVSPVTDTTYTLSSVSAEGCGIASDSVKVQVFKKLIIPNSFSPNGDGINDTWNITALQGYADFTLSVFNRYGQLVYLTHKAFMWDGRLNNKLLPIGVYYYVIELQNKMPQQFGSLLLIR